MAPLVLEGATLGEKHQNYNKLIQERSTRKQHESTKLDSEQGDIENLIKIDLANNNKDVEYILEVLKSEDSLYVSRAIKKITWIVHDQQYAHVINPKYLHDQLFPQMTSKAINKLLLHIRLNLKDQQRAEDFYKYYLERDQGKALKWLPYCSVSFIEEIAKGDITLPDTLLKRLTIKSFSILEIYLKNQTYSRTRTLEATKFLLNSNAEKYLDLVESSLNKYDRLCFGEKYTDVIMTKCPERIFKKFPLYAFMVDTKTFVKYIKQEEVKDFLVKHSKNEMLQSFFHYQKLKEFLTRMPVQGRFELIKEMFIDKTAKMNEASMLNESDCLTKSCFPHAASTASVYQWYGFAPFETALSDLKKLIRVESSPIERNNMLAVLITCAGRNMQHIETLLQFYHEKHINEPFKFKIGFINRVLSHINISCLNDKSWNILNELFHSMEVYIESTNNVQTCIKAIILYRIANGQDIPEIIEKKFEFSTFKETQYKLQKGEKEAIFNYLHNLMLKKIDSQCLTSQSDCEDMVNLITNVLNLLKDWDKQLLDYPIIVNKIREVINIKVQNSWKVDLSCIYNINKTWRKHLFEESIIMCPSESVCMNALKHDPELLTRHENVVEAICTNDAVSLKQMHSKLRVYWPQSLAEKWTRAYLERLDKPDGHRILIRGLCVLLSEKPLQEIIKKYAPQDSKISWNIDDEHTLSLRRYISKTMHIARPLIPLDAVLLYAKGDYLQYAIPSVNAILYNQSCDKSRVEIRKLLNAPVSLQKFGIRYAFKKLQPEELKTIFYELWKLSKNPTIRTVLFTHTYDLLCNEKDVSMIHELKKLLNLFIDNLTAEENVLIYNKFTNVGQVPLEVRAEIFMKSYLFLKSLPEKANCEHIVKSLSYYSPTIIHLFEAEFVENILLKPNLDLFSTKECDLDILASYLLSAKDEKSQLEKYYKILQPILEHPPSRESLENNKFYYKNFKTLLHNAAGSLKKFFIDKNGVNPIKMFTDIQEKLEKALLIDENYELMTMWKLIVSYVKLVQEYKSLLLLETNNTLNEDNSSIDTDDKWIQMNLKLQSSFAGICIGYLEEDVKKHFSSIYLLFGNALNEFFRIIFNDEDSEFKYNILQVMIRDDLIQSYLLIYSMWPSYCYRDDVKAKLLEIRQLLLANPSAELKMHYYSKFANKSDSEI